MSASNGVPRVTRVPLRLSPDPRRVLTRLFIPGQPKAALDRFLKAPPKKRR